MTVYARIRNHGWAFRGHRTPIRKDGAVEAIYIPCSSDIIDTKHSHDFVCFHDLAEGVDPINSFSASQERPLPPDTCEQIVAEVSPVRQAIFRQVRQFLDQLEEVAPWDRLYYPPPDAKEFMAMEVRFLKLVDSIPRRMHELLNSFDEASLDEAHREMVDDAHFFFNAIHESVSHDLGKLRTKLKALSVTAGSITLSEAERHYTSELTADLKGKYGSSMMGATANLVAGEEWNGVEIEPILFVEKAEEFERNELLVETLSEVVENITNLLRDVPLAEAVETWKQGERVDQYALTSLYNFLGNIGKLMKDKCRRALYSGDYHQIQKRETLLSTRINELQLLHNISWGTAPSGSMGEGDSPFPKMILKATELAAILDINILREIIGEKPVKLLLDIVTIEREKSEPGSVEPTVKSGLRKHLPEELHSLISLLRDDDLNNFLSLLLGSVLKRASLGLQRRREQEEAQQQLEEIFEGESQPSAASLFGLDAAGSAEPSSAAPAPPPPTGPPEIEQMLEIDTSLLEALPDYSPPAPRPPAPQSPPPPPPPSPPAAPAFDGVDELDGLDDLGGVTFGGSFDTPSGGFAADSESETFAPVEEPGFAVPSSAVDDPMALEKLDALRALQEIFLPLLSRSNSHRKSFELVHRLLKQKKVVPPAMLHSMHPYLFDLMNKLVPKLNGLPDMEELSDAQGPKLIEICTFLCRKQFTPDQLKGVVPETMQRLIRLLNGLSSIISSSIQDLEQQTGGMY